MPESNFVTLGQVINDAIESSERRMAVSLPGTVVSYSSATQTATVRVGVNRLVPSEADPDVLVSEPLPAVQSVPVAWPRGANFAFEGSLNPGDPVLLIAQDRDIDGWLASGQPADPQDSRMHAWGSAVAIPGLTAAGSFPVPPTDAAALANTLDAILLALKSWAATPPGATAEADIVTLRTALVGPGAPLATFLTCASDVLKLGA